MLDDRFCPKPRGEEGADAKRERRHNKAEHEGRLDGLRGIGANLGGVFFADGA